MGQSQSKETAEAWDNTGDEKELLSLLLMGKTGHGKSSLGNSLLGCDIFKVSNNTSSQTAEVVCGHSNFESFSLKVVDGPSLQDTHLDELEDTERAVRNMSVALKCVLQGLMHSSLSTNVVLDSHQKKFPCLKLSRLFLARIT